MSVSGQADEGSDSDIDKDDYNHLENDYEWRDQVGREAVKSICAFAEDLNFKRNVLCNTALYS